MAKKSEVYVFNSAISTWTGIRLWWWEEKTTWVETCLFLGRRTNASLFCYVRGFKEVDFIHDNNLQRTIYNRTLKERCYIIFICHQWENTSCQRHTEGIQICGVFFNYFTNKLIIIHCFCSTNRRQPILNKFNDHFTKYGEGVECHPPNRWTLFKINPLGTTLVLARIFLTFSVTSIFDCFVFDAIDLEFPVSLVDTSKWHEVNNEPNRESFRFLLAILSSDDIKGTTSALVIQWVAVEITFVKFVEGEWVCCDKWSGDEVESLHSVPSLSNCINIDGDDGGELMGDIVQCWGVLVLDGGPIGEDMFKLRFEMELVFWLWLTISFFGKVLCPDVLL